MTQLDPRSPTTTPPSTPTPGGRPVKEGPSFNWRVSLGMAIGLVVLFGVLFGLRALGIFPPRPAEDPEIAAVRATLAALPAHQPAPAAQPTLVPTQPPAPATLGAIVLATPAPTSAAESGATAVSVQANAPVSAPTQQPATNTQKSSTAGTLFETAPTPVATVTSALAPTASTSNPASASSPAEATSTPDVSSLPGPTPVATDLPASLASALLQSYTNYWNIRLQAIENPTDVSVDLESVMAGNELEGARKTLAQMRDNNEAGYSTVKHTIWITHANDQAAVIIDRYVAQTIKLDPESKAPLQSAPTIERYADTFQLQNLDGTWKVVREDAGELQ